MKITEELRNILPVLLQSVSDYVQVNNEYISVKALEEKTKGKKQKPNAVVATDLNVLDLGQEQEKVFDTIVSGFPEVLRPIIRDKVLVSVGLKAEVQSPVVVAMTTPVQVNPQDTMTGYPSNTPTAVVLAPPKGDVWNVVKCFYDNFQKKQGGGSNNQ